MRKVPLRRLSDKKARAASGPVYSTLTPSGKPKRKRRKPSEFARIYGSKERVAWIKTLPCYNCGGRASEDCRIVAAHIRNGGMSRKADAEFTIPLCELKNGAGCHQVQHANGWSWLVRLTTRTHRERAARQIEADWNAHCAARRPVSEN